MNDVKLGAAVLAACIVSGVLLYMVSMNGLSNWYVLEWGRW